MAAGSAAIVPQPARRGQTARLGVVEVLYLPHLVLAHVRDDGRIS